MIDLDAAQRLVDEAAERNLAAHFADEVAAAREMARAYAHDEFTEAPWQRSAVETWQRDAEDAETIVDILNLLPELVAALRDHAGRRTP